MILLRDDESEIIVLNILLGGSYDISKSLFNRTG